MHVILEAVLVLVKTEPILF